MSWWRVAVVSALIVLPFLVLAGVGSYALWNAGYGLLSWAFVSTCLGLGYILGWYWQSRKQLLTPISWAGERHWTDRDQAAWLLVEARAKAAAELNADSFVDLDFYLTTAKEMTQELARFYHPRATDPTDALTIPEILAVAELAAADLAEIVDRYLPGGHLLTISDYRRARNAVDLYQKASNLYWLIAGVFSPITTGAKYAAQQVGLSTPLRLLQNNLLLWFFTAYINRLGSYLIDLNSGRLRVGAKRYRELTRAAPAAVADGEPAEAVSAVTLTILGQVKAGKSSFVNALLGEQRARTDVLPATDQVTKYLLQTPGVPGQLALLDTVGYSHEGPRADQVKVTRDTARQSDLIVLVMHARNPARQADVAMLKGLREWFASRPDLKMPPVIGVMTHIDLLSPTMEWAPPYDWKPPRRPKEEQIAAAMAAVNEQFGDALAGVAPVCVVPGKVFGIDEAFLPALAALLDEVHAVAFLRCLRAEIDAGQARKVFYQLLELGKGAVRAVWQTHS